MTTDAPTIAERYSRAVSSTDLMLRDEPGPVDILIASGWCKDGLGTRLYRLRTEFDAVKATIPASVGAVNQRMLVMMALRTRLEAHEALDETARRHDRIGHTEDDLHNLTWRVLSAWLDPNCHHCEGRGFNGGYDGPQILCRPCSGSGSRRREIGRNADERVFAVRLGVLIDAAVDDVAQKMRRYLRNRAN